MYHNILIPVAPDHPERLSEQLSVARALAADGAKITVVSVIEAVPLYIAAEVPAVIFEQAQDEAEEALKTALKDEADVTLQVVHGHAPTLILDKIKDVGADLVVVRSHKPDMSDWFLGSTAGRVVRHAPCGVHVIR
ncbi:Nucleotide-binding universal stress protein, UspA family [Roseivivax lentus]|uniref:Nucleotide-binding universal stress protein, UspA family n=1 Tax=Roseivivax lentus TaxID=633194 RepID=A0A1N7NFW6_9RHOB|nr:universal stress protein [Roseivivax lentus]SIS97254.1 Nucleotide-binding universal stress protein, UspA family [Roseivivax lentus]